MPQIIVPYLTPPSRVSCRLCSVCTRYLRVTTSFRFGKLAMYRSELLRRELVLLAEVFCTKWKLLRQLVMLSNIFTRWLRLPRQNYLFRKVKCISSLRMCCLKVCIEVVTLPILGFAAAPVIAHDFNCSRSGVQMLSTCLTWI